MLCPEKHSENVWFTVWENGNLIVFVSGARGELIKNQLEALIHSTDYYEDVTIEWTTTISGVVLASMSNVDPEMCRDVLRVVEAQTGGDYEDHV